VLVRTEKGHRPPGFPEACVSRHVQLVSRVLCPARFPALPLTGARAGPSRGGGHFSRRAVADAVWVLRPKRSTRPRRPDRRSRLTPDRGLLDLARGGVCHASAVTGRAVRSYRTVSPLPDPPKGPSAVCSLLHFPSSRGVGRVGVTHHRVLSCSDFPRTGAGHPGRTRPPCRTLRGILGSKGVWQGTRGTRQMRRGRRGGRIGRWRSVWPCGPCRIRPNW
jgi:hypothetical protein